MKPLTADDIRSSFVNATADQLERLPIPGLHEAIWEEREFLGWRDTQAARLGYIVHWEGDRPVGVVVRAAPGGLRPGIAAMCSLCHSSQPATQVRMFSAPKAGEAGARGGTIGTYICEDLNCPMLIRVAPAQRTLPQSTVAYGSHADLGEPTIGHVGAASRGLLERVRRFTANVAKTA